MPFSRPPPGRIRSPVASPAGPAARDGVIDLWRGLALVDMAWIHLIHNYVVLPDGLAPLLRDHTRFAAGAFVLLAGLSVRTVFGEALARGGDAARAVNRRLWRRALLLLVLDRVLAIGVVGINRWRSFLPGGEDPLAPFWPYLTFQEPGVTGGLLLLYALLLALTPALAALARRAGWACVAALSLAAYAGASLAGDPFHWPPWTFPLAYWQPLFVAGLVAAPAWRWLRDGGTGRVAAWAAAAAVVYAVLQLVRHGGIGPGLPDTLFTKVPLRPLELLRYAVATQLVFAAAALGWTCSACARRAAGGLFRIGRNSLVVYAAHLFVEVPIVELAWSAPPSAWLGCAALALDAVALAGVAAIAEWSRSAAAASRTSRARAARLSWPWLPRGAVVGAGVALASLVALRAVQLALPPEATIAEEPAAVHAIAEDVGETDELAEAASAPEITDPIEPELEPEATGT